MNQTTNSGATPLCKAAEEGHVSALLVLLHAGATVDPEEDQIGDTPLSSAAHRAQVNSVKVLLAYAANGNRRTPFGTPLEIATLEGHIGVIELFNEYFSDPTGLQQQWRKEADSATEKLLAAIEKNLQASEEQIVKQNQELIALEASSSSTSNASTSQSSAASITARLTQDYHDEIKRIAEQEHQEFLGLLEADYKRLLTEYQHLGQRGFESNLQARQQQFETYLASQQQTLQAQGTQQQSQFAEALQTVLAQYQGQALASLSDSAVQSIGEQLREKLGNEFTDSMQNLLDSQQYKDEIQRLQQRILQRIQEHQDKIKMKMIHLRQKQKQITNEHDPLFKQYQQQQQTLAEQRSLQTHPSVCLFYNTIEKILGSRLVGAMSLASGMITRASTSAEDAIEIGVIIAEKIVSAVPAIGPVIDAVVGGGLKIGQLLHEKYVDKKHDQEFKNTLDSVIRLDDALVLAELVARRLAQSYQRHITQNNLSMEETEVAGENAANIVYGCIKSGGLIPLTTKSVDEKVTYLVNIVHAEAQKQKGFFSRKAAVFKKPVAAQDSQATREEVHALRKELSDVQAKSELEKKQMKMELDRQKKESDEMKAKLARIEQMQQAKPAHTSAHFKPAAVTPVSFSLLSETTWAVAIEQLRQNTSTTLLNVGNLQIQRTEKKLTLSTTRQFSSKEKDFEVLGAMIKKMFSGDVEDWEVDKESLVVTVEASQKAKKLEIFLGQAFAIKAASVLSVSAPAPQSAPILAPPARRR